MTPTIHVCLPLLEFPESLLFPTGKFVAVARKHGIDQNPEWATFIRNMVIERVCTFKLLGVTTADDLNWDSHCHIVVMKANKQLYALRQLKCGFSSKDIILVYCSVVRSVLEYSCLLFKAFPNTSQNRYREFRNEQWTLSPKFKLQVSPHRFM